MDGSKSSKGRPAKSTGTVRTNQPLRERRTAGTAARNSTAVGGAQNLRRMRDCTFYRSHFLLACAIASRSFFYQKLKRRVRLAHRKSLLKGFEYILSPVN